MATRISAVVLVPLQRNKTVAVAGLLGIVFASLLVDACYSDRAVQCNAHSDCTHGICTSDGVCGAECLVNADCPSGSFCASSCGLCVTDDLKGPSTCRPYSLGLSSVSEVTGACRRDLTDSGVADAGQSATIRTSESCSSKSQSEADAVATETTDAPSGEVEDVLDGEVAAAADAVEGG